MIRILHTADWHLGREFYGHDMSGLHEHFFDWLAGEVESRNVDLLLMAGDIFDRAQPPVDAIRMCNRRLAELSDLTRVVMITGNHDSPARLSHGPLLRPNLHLAADTGNLAEPVLVENPFPLAIYAIPYLDPTTTAVSFGLEQRSHEAVLGEAVRRCLEDLDSRPGTRAIAVAHAFITGARSSDLERSIQVGGSESVPSTLFDGFDYVALGHLHRPQSVSGDRVRYSGSPIPLSFSEVGTGTPKSVTVIDLEADGTFGLERIEIPQAVRMARIEGELEELINDPDLDDLKSAWLEITLTDRVRPDRPVDRLRSRFKGLIHPRFTAPSLAEIESPDSARIRKLDAKDVVTEFFRHIRGEGGEPDGPERAVIGRAFDEHTVEDDRA